MKPLLFQWDAKIISDVTEHGYQLDKPNIQVLPAFPMLVRLFHWFINDWQWAAIIATQVASFFAFYYLYRLARLELDERESLLAVILFAIFPTAFFLSVPYMESLFCAVTFACVFYLRRKQYVPAAVTGLVVTMTRMTGVFLLPALLISVFFDSKVRRERSQLLGLASVALAMVLGYAVYLGLNKSIYGSTFFFLQHESTGWHIHLTWPFSGAIDAIRGWSGRTPEQRFSLVIVELSLTAFAFLGLWGAYQRRNFFDLTYAGLTLWLLVSLSFWLSNPRLVLPLYTVFTTLAAVSYKRPMILISYSIVSIGLLALYLAHYLSGQWAF